MDQHSDTSVARHARDLETYLEERGVVEGAELDAIIDRFLTVASPLNGARIVVRAWLDDDFRARLLDDGNAAIAELGLSAGGLQPQQLRVVANGPTVHNVLVCTLCSCYPIGLLGPSPSWYKSEAYRSRVVREPRAVLAEFGLVLDDGVDIRVWDTSAETRYMVLPRRPAGTDAHTEDELVELVTRSGLIGTAAV